MGPLQGAMLQSEEDHTRKLSVTFPAPVATALGLRLNSEAWLPYRTEISYLCQSVHTHERNSKRFASKGSDLKLRGNAKTLCGACCAWVRLALLEVFSSSGSSEPLA